MTSVLAILILVHLGLLLSVTGVVKAADLRTFDAQLTAHELVPRQLVRVVAVVVPAIEISLGLWLVSGRAPQIALLATVAIFAVFLIYHALMRLNRVEVPCGCSGSVTSGRHDALAESIALLFNISLALAAQLLVGSTPAMYSAYVTALACGLVAAGLLTTFVIAHRRVSAQARTLAWMTSVVTRSVSPSGT